ncbi:MULTISPECIES: DUF1654 domain-containing protein [Pseudomonas syringae group]|uniref:DUF1654 domain-containing protein n=8 Tax=Pseudomonas syringae group TaxID=136849 RepID=A0AAD0GR10_9PSED|nr:MULTISPECIES: DUF1654 domain-containing protein [Pseudomonas syringae group]AVB21649.1 DUF1654 domain-containing protein [Pseudomonas avellanae]EGH11452.1 hypothetical protein PSYMP_17390 [Pseudomonas amygdali pv. morsprunorum str. M302280]KPX14280.1 Uncharacterized protein ALO72_03909 [Pseudomonas syringae pv. delphinii]KPZ19220.1 Uncharacterized protein ALO40_02745 [Pseudomonas syringae pv. viburni]KWS58774.1 hypothetical protein AL055_04785 [Pseudomonas amygdali pv. morsprunorum]
MADINNPVRGESRSYEQIGRRIQRLVSAPDVQKIQWVIVTRQEDEARDGWDRVLQEISETEGIEVDWQRDGSVRIGWQRYIDN